MLFGPFFFFLNPPIFLRLYNFFFYICKQFKKMPPAHYCHSQPAHHQSQLGPQPCFPLKITLCLRNWANNFHSLSCKSRFCSAEQFFFFFVLIFFLWSAVWKVPGRPVTTGKQLSAKWKPCFTGSAWRFHFKCGWNKGGGSQTHPLRSPKAPVHTHSENKTLFS